MMQTQTAQGYIADRLMEMDEIHNRHKATTTIGYVKHLEKFTTPVLKQAFDAVELDEFYPKPGRLIELCRRFSGGNEKDKTYNAAENAASREVFAIVMKLPAPFSNIVGIGRHASQETLPMLKQVLELQLSGKTVDEVAMTMGFTRNKPWGYWEHLAPVIATV
jgi:hypothetical protein